MESERLYGKTIMSIEQNLKHNLIENIRQLHGSLTLESMHPNIRGKMFYNILSTLGRVKKSEIPEVYSVHEIHTIIHEELMGLGMSEYVRLVSKLFLHYPHGTPKLLLVSPYIPGSYDILLQFNTKLVYYIMMSSMRFEYSPIFDNALFNHVSKNWQILSHYVEVTNKRQELQILLEENFPLCDNDAYADDVAIVVRNGFNISSEMRKLYPLIQLLNSYKYKVTLFHTSKGLNDSVYKDLFYDIIFLDPLFTMQRAKKQFENRYRAAFFTDDSGVWSLFMASIRIGIKQFSVGKLDLGEIDAVFDDFSITHMVPTNIELYKKSSDKFIIYCPLSVSELRANYSKIRDMKINNNAVVLFCADGPYEAHRFKTVFEWDDDIIILDGTENGRAFLDDYYSMFNAIDCVACGSYNIALDAIYFNKPVISLSRDVDYILSSLELKPATVHCIPDQKQFDMNEFVKHHNNKVVEKFQTFISQDLPDRSLIKN